MAVTSAGILLYRLVEGAPEVLIAHMGGPYWSGKDAGAWSIPKGEYDPDDEGALDAARREFAEELGVPAPDGPYAELGTFAYSSGKRVTVFVADGAASRSMGSPSASSSSNGRLVRGARGRSPRSTGSSGRRWMPRASAS